jgi:hypothetical protein
VIGIKKEIMTKRCSYQKAPAPSTQHAAPITKLIITYMNTVITMTWNKGGNGNGRWENGE